MALVPWILTGAGALPLAGGGVRVPDSSTRVLTKNRVPAGNDSRSRRASSARATAASRRTARTDRRMNHLLHGIVTPGRNVESKGGGRVVYIVVAPGRTLPVERGRPCVRL